MFSAVSNLGAGGTQDTALSDISNSVLYGMFALTGLVSGGINNRASLLMIRELRPLVTMGMLLYHSAWTASDPCHRVAGLFVVYWLLVVVSHSRFTGFPLPHQR
jgi:hypothetical protein